MKHYSPWCAVTLAIAALLPPALAKDGHVHLSAAGTNVFLGVKGDAEDEWRFQASTNLVTWNDAPALGTLLSGTNVVMLATSNAAAPRCFYRAVKTTGLYDSNVLRTINLTFTQANWHTLLESYHGTTSSALATLELGGTNYPGVGVRYRGNTSYSPTNLKNSLNIQIDYTNPEARLMGYKTLNLNNANADNTIMREPLYFNIMRAYTVCPHGCFMKLNINGAYWGVYSSVQQEDGILIKEYLPSNDGDRWLAPNVGGGGGGPGGGGGFSSALSALSYLGTNVATYQANYELKSDLGTNTWQHLIHATDVLNNTATNVLRDKVEDVLAVDRWLWFLVLENLFADEDSYWYKGADYAFYYEPESGRIHPVEHDGNETWYTADVSVTPVQGSGATNRPVLNRFLGNAELRQRYLAHMRTVLQESFNPTALNPVITQYMAISVDAIAADPKKSFTMVAYTNAVAALRSFVASRYSYLTNHTELKPLAPVIVAVTAPNPAPAPTEAALITAQVQANGTNGISSVWLYYRPYSYGRFAAVQMFDDGAHSDGAAGDGTFGAATTNYPADTKVRYYVEARSANSAHAASFAPARAEQETYSYRVGLTTATNTPVIINELMASNTATIADPQGQYEDWIELRNLTDQDVDLTGKYLTDDPTKPRQWQFSTGTTIPADGYLLVWADNDTADTPGLHANFKLSAAGEQVLLLDTDANLNAVLDAVTFGAQRTDLSYGRSAADADVWVIMDPTPGLPNW